MLLSPCLVLQNTKHLLRSAQVLFLRLMKWLQKKTAIKQLEINSIHDGNKLEQFF